ncbi:MAG TPA: hypothetical protein VLI39_00790 [Sedimentisphaerales bacterium]|nr:hypothetical protein [Sedimentisphaerales bacterium]
MDLQDVSRRLFLGQGAMITLAMVLSGCTRTVTKYRPDGTAYTEEEEDWGQTLAAVLLGLLLLGLLAAAAAGDDESSDAGWDDEQDRSRRGRENDVKVHLASAGSNRNPSARDTETDILLLDNKGSLLAAMDAARHVTLYNVDSVGSLLKNGEIENLDRQIAIRLRKDNLNRYLIDHLCIARNPSGEEGKVFYRRVRGELYRIKVITGTENSVELQIVQTQDSPENGTAAVAI